MNIPVEFPVLCPVRPEFLFPGYKWLKNPVVRHRAKYPDVDQFERRRSSWNAQRFCLAMINPSCGEIERDVADRGDQENSAGSYCSLFHPLSLRPTNNVMMASLRAYHGRRCWIPPIRNP